ncbi:type II toxin-antitoxin system VapC family toxin [Gemmatimonas sp.]|uniref:type II toxin-antitoxin system VapC family toxin n=1 Tax=Gemmatimonas sp. TaxID=1962908 RepID=UPI00286D7EE3|nr:type II toxin-antitoxin system VapC family toxin [Gemmatimonas sp.]
MILIDANILMYAAGAAHPHKAPSARLLERVARGDVAATINAETLQEILHRYRAIKRWTDGRQVYDLARQLFPSVVPISVEMLDRARELLDHHPALMARDALQAAVVLHEGLEAICSYDRDFDVIPSLVRIEP